MKNHLKITEWLLALTKTRQKKKGYLRKEHVNSGAWSAVGRENFTEAHGPQDAQPYEEEMIHR